MFVKSLITSFAFVSLLASAALGNMCACCSEPGTYMIRTSRPDAHYLGILKEIRFDKGAFLYMTEAGFDGTKGLSSIEKEFEDGSWVASPGSLDLVNSFTGREWTFTIKSPKGKTGVLKLPVPSQMLTFKVDIHDGETSGGGGPLLYKEMRFKGTVSAGTGFLASSIVRPTSYFLVFQGRGNACDNAEDFKTWNLEITGRNASYQFFGQLTSGRGSDESAVTEKAGAFLTLQ